MEAPPPQLLIGLFLSLFVGGTNADGLCLQDNKHKATPSPEPRLLQCVLYADNSCCKAEHIAELSYVPSAELRSDSWDRCGPLTAQCESFLKRISCFHRCSPDAARWPHPQRRSSIQAVPLCHSFCNQWFDACKTDYTCARNWARDPRGQNCTGTCVQYQQMFQHGTDLCETLWGDAFVSVEDDPVGGGRPCGCLTLSPSDRDVMAALRATQDDPEELDTTKAGLPQYRAPCQAKKISSGSISSSISRRNSRNSRKLVLKKRSAQLDDAEGSGSGL